MGWLKKNIPTDIEKDREELHEEEDSSEEDIPKNLPENELMRVEIEHLKAKVESLLEFNKSTNERLQALNEQIGEMRNAGYERDKKVGEIEAKTMRAIEIVHEIEPEKIIEMTQKADMKFQQLAERITSTRLYIDNIMEEIKRMKEDMKVFKNTKEIIDLDRDIKTELLNVQKIKSVVDMHASKVEGIFIEMQKQYSNNYKMASFVDEMRKSVENMIKEINSMKVKLPVFADRESVEKINKKLVDYEESLQKIRQSNDSLSKFIDSFEGLKNNPDMLRKIDEIIAKQELHEEEIKSSHEFTEQLLEEIKDLSESMSDNKENKNDKNNKNEREEKNKSENTLNEISSKISDMRKKEQKNKPNNEDIDELLHKYHLRHHDLEDLKKFIKSSIAAEKSKDEIIEILNRVGWPHAIVDRIIDSMM